MEYLFLTDITKDVISNSQADKFKYNRGGIADAVEQRGLSKSQVESVQNIDLAKRISIDKEALENIVRK